MRRVRLGEIVAGAAAAVLLVAMFLDWYGVRGRREAISAWEAFGVVDVLLALVALLGIALLVTQLVGRGPALPVALGVIGSTLGLVATLLVAYRLLNQPGPNDVIEVDAGAWLGLAATALVFLGTWRSIGDERPRPVDPAPPEPERRPTPARS
jgi:hypothetical protein